MPGQIKMLALTLVFGVAMSATRGRGHEKPPHILDRRHFTDLSPKQFKEQQEEFYPTGLPNWCKVRQPCFQSMVERCVREEKSKKKVRVWQLNDKCTNQRRNINVTVERLNSGHEVDPKFNGGKPYKAKIYWVHQPVRTKRSGPVGCQLVHVTHYLNGANREAPRGKRGGISIWMACIEDGKKDGLFVDYSSRSTAQEQDEAGYVYRITYEGHVEERPWVSWMSGKRQSDGYYNEHPEYSGMAEDRALWYANDGRGQFGVEGDITRY